MQVRWEDRLFVTGTTGSGKSELARRLFAAAPGRRLVIDPKNDPDATTGGGMGPVVTFHDAARIPDVMTARFVPRDPFDADTYDRLYRSILEGGPRFVWADELGVIAPAQSAPAGVRTLIMQGRAKHIGHMGCHPRPVDLSRSILSQSQHVIVHRLPDPDDRDHVRRVMQRPRAELESHMASLGEFGFLWFDVRRNHTTVVRQGLRL